MTPIYYEGSLYGYKYTPAVFQSRRPALHEEDKREPGALRSFRLRKLAHSPLVRRHGFGYLSPDTSFTAKTYFERVETQKISSYGFAEYSSSFIIEEKLIMDHNLTLLGIPMKLSYGGEADFTSVDELSDFSVEPFNRRDTTNPVIVPQSVVLVGPQDGWIAGDGDVSQLIQYAFFAQADIKFTPSLSLFTGGEGRGRALRHRNARAACD
jgi:hypothetical protein